MKKIESIKSHVFLVVITFLMIGMVSCDDECTTCTLNEMTTEVCLDGEIEYTDLDGNVLPDSEVIAFFESAGYECE